MNGMSGVNLSPLVHLLLMGLAVAFGPLLWVWLRQRHLGGAGLLRALTLITLFLTFDLVLFGAFTRLTDSGLGCPDWPGCYGHASPVGASSAIAAAQEAMPSGPVTASKAWIEMLHRYMATGVGVLIITLTLAHWRERRQPGVPSLAWPVLTLLTVCLQGAFGALTVTMKLFPAIVTLHLLGSLLLLALLAAQASRYAVDRGTVLPAPLRAALAGVALLLALQIALGGWVSTNYAVLACQDFPQCQGSWWPPMDFRDGFTLWRPLGMTATGEAINFSALTAIHFSHRLLAGLVLVALLTLAWALHRQRGWQGPARALAGLSLLQLLTGLGNVVLGWPLPAALAHTGGAAALMGTLGWSLGRSAPRAASAPVPSWGVAA